VTVRMYMLLLVLAVPTLALAGPRGDLRRGQKLYFMARYQEAAERLAGAVDELDRLKPPDRPRALMLYGAARAKLGLQAFERVHSARSVDAVVALLESSVHHMQASVELLTRARDLDYWPWSDMADNALHVAGPSVCQLGSHLLVFEEQVVETRLEPEALAQTCVKAMPDDPLSWAVLGQVRRELGHDHESNHAFTRAVLVWEELEEPRPSAVVMAATALSALCHDRAPLDGEWPSAADAAYVLELIEPRWDALLAARESHRHDPAVVVAVDQVGEWRTWYRLLVPEHRKQLIAELEPDPGDATLVLVRAHLAESREDLDQAAPHLDRAEELVRSAPELADEPIAQDGWLARIDVVRASALNQSLDDPGADRDAIQAQLGELLHRAEPALRQHIEHEPSSWRWYGDLITLARLRGDAEAVDGWTRIRDAALQSAAR